MTYRFNPMSSNRGLELAVELASVAISKSIECYPGVVTFSVPLSGLRDSYAYEHRQCCAGRQPDFADCTVPRETKGSLSQDRTQLLESWIQSDST